MPAHKPAQTEQNSLNQTTLEFASHEIGALLPAFAIGATDVDEVSLVKRLLAENPALAAGLADYSALADTLLFAMPLVAPPLSLETHLQIAIAETGVAQKTEQTPLPVERNRSKQNSTQQNKKWWEIFLSSQRSPVWAVGFAGIACLLLLSGYLNNQIKTLHQVQKNLEFELQQNRTTLSVMAMEDSQRIVLAPTNQENEFDADLIWGEGFETALLYVDKFPQLETGTIYQLWLCKGTQYTNAGTFGVNQFGNGTLIVQLSKPVDDFDGLEITIEPTGGSFQPTTSPLVHGNPASAILAEAK